MTAFDPKRTLSASYFQHLVGAREPTRGRAASWADQAPSSGVRPLRSSSATLRPLNKLSALVWAWRFSLLGYMNAAFVQLGTNIALTFALPRSVHRDYPAPAMAKLGRESVDLIEHLLVRIALAVTFLSLLDSHIRRERPVPTRLATLTVVAPQAPDRTPRADPARPLVVVSAITPSRCIDGVRLQRLGSNGWQQIGSCQSATNP